MSEDAPEVAPVLLLPGWQNSGPTHWQSRWEALYGDRRVEQADWLRPLRGDWMARLEEVLLAERTPVVLVAHSLGCQLVAAWAAQSQHTARVHAALLVAPPDTERADMPAELHSWRPVRRQRLPFAATVVVSTDDPYCSHFRAMGFAADWGAEVVSIGPCGHINGESGLGDWPAGRELLDTLRARAA
jgi:uncharacterized protein